MKKDGQIYMNSEKIIETLKSRVVAINNIAIFRDEYKRSDRYSEAIAKVKYINHWNASEDFYALQGNLRDNGLIYVKTSKVSNKYTNLLGGAGYLFKNLSFDEFLNSKFIFEEDLVSLCENGFLNYGLSQLELSISIANRLEKLESCWQGLERSFESTNELKMFLAVLYQNLSFDWRPIYNQKQYTLKDQYEVVEGFDTLMITNRINPSIHSGLLGGTQATGRREIVTCNSSSMMNNFSRDYNFQINKLSVDNVSVQSVYHNVSLVNNSDAIFSRYLHENLKCSKIILDDPVLKITVEQMFDWVSDGNVVYVPVVNLSGYDCLLAGRFKVNMFISNILSADNLSNYNYFIFSHR
jgi:hypothetical protein